MSPSVSVGGPKPVVRQASKLMMASSRLRAAGMASSHPVVTSITRAILPQQQEPVNRIPQSQAERATFDIGWSQP